jgi:DUF2971 family protein
MKPDFDPGLSLQRSVDQYGVICFSTDGDISTQWQIYASKGRGVCLEFDSEKDPEFFKKVKPVDYVGQLEPANVFTDTTEAQVRKCLYAKLVSYEKEDEFRALFPGVRVNRSLLSPRRSWESSRVGLWRSRSAGAWRKFSGSEW